MKNKRRIPRRGAALLAAAITLQCACGMGQAYAAEYTAGPGQTEESNLAAAEAAAVLADNNLEFSEIRARLEKYNAEYVNTYHSTVESSLDLDTARELAEEAGRFMEDAKDVWSEDMGEEDRALYETYKETARELRKSAQELTGDELSKSVLKSLDQALDTKEQLAQNRYMEYEKALYALAPAQKEAEMKEALYQAALTKQAAGLYAGASVTQAEKDMYAARKQLEAKQSALDTARANLLMILGFDPATEVTIGEIPGIDESLFLSANLEEDTKTAVASNQSFASIRRQKASGNADRTVKSRTVAYTEAEITTQMAKLYGDLEAKKLALDGQKLSFAKAGSNYQTANARYQGGLLGRSEYLQAETEYLNAVSAEKNAELDYYKAWLTYRWAVAGMM